MDISNDMGVSKLSAKVFFVNYYFKILVMVLFGCWCIPTNVQMNAILPLQIFRKVLEKLRSAGRTSTGEPQTSNQRAE